jgi:hypothetical protein
MKLNLKRSIPYFFGGILLVSCGGPADTNKINDELLDPSSSLNTDFDGKIFSIPSPIQMALLLKESKAPFNQALLNDIKNVSKYTTEFRQALNLGIYGADLGYASINDQNSASLSCLSAVETLTDKLGLDGVFDKSFMTRFEKNKTNTDSVLLIVSEAFKAGDNYLKNEKRKSTSSLILTGGWIESMYYACELHKTNSSYKIVERIGEQQQTMSTIIEILKEYNENNLNDSLIAEMSDLKVDFDKIVIEYDFVEPVTYERKKLTVLKHNSTVKVDPKVLEQIAVKINSIRANIIN